jgi:AcrR family transcriptional regulator
MRRRQAEQTRWKILEASRELFLGRGYAGTTVGEIAEAAGVSPKTVSAAFGSKRGILAGLLSFDRFGQRFGELVGRIRVAPDPRERVELAAHITSQAYESLKEFELLRCAGAVDPELGELARQIGQRRRQNQAKLIAYLHESGALRAGLDPERATDELWALTSYDLYRQFVVELRWGRDRYEAWLADVLAERLLERTAFA